MMYKVLLGSVRTDVGTFSVGEKVELPQKEGDALIGEGVVELVTEEQSQVSAPEVKQPVKRATRPSRKAQSEAEVGAEAAPLAEPSLDWTLSELISYADGKGIELPLDGSKEQVLEAIKGGDKG